MKKLCLVGACLFACWGARAQSWSFVGDADKNPLTYAVGETMTFTVTLVDKDSANAAVTGQELRWTLKDDGGQTASGTATSDAPLVVTHAMTNAGCTRLTVNVYTNSVKLAGASECFDGGAVAGFADVREWPRPADFDAVWAAATNTLLSTAYTPTLTPYEPADGDNANIDYFVYSLPVPSSPDWPATGVIALPKDRANGELGIISHTFGYGYYGKIETPSAKEVFASERSNIVIHMTRYGENPVGDDAYYADLAANAMKGYGFRNFTSLEACDQYMTHLRNLRALQYAKSRAEWDGAHLTVIGGSLGGYQALALAGLDPDVSACQVNVPWSVDLGGVNLGYMKGWRPDWVEGVTDYIDAKNFAYNIGCPITVTAGLGDYTCPPSGQVQLYNILKAPKKITFTQNTGHGSNRGPVCASYTLSEGFDTEPDPDPVVRRTMEFIGGTGSWKLAANWRDADGKTNDLPRATDIVSLPAAADGACNDWDDFEAYQLRLSAFNQGYNSASKPIILDASGGGIYDTGYIYCKFPIRVRGTNMPFCCTQFLGMTGPFSSADGQPFGLVKTGTAIGGLSPASLPSGTTDPYAGLKYIDVAEGSFAFNANAKVGDAALQYFPTNLVLTFSGLNTAFMFNGHYALTNLTLRETGNALGRTHAISPQGAAYSGSLALGGTLGADDTVLTGSMTGNFAFTWDPATAQTFTFSNRFSAAAFTGALAVKNGTVRFCEGAYVKGVSEINLAGANARLALEDVPSNTCTAAFLRLKTGSERLALDAGATLTVETARVGNAAIPAGTYTGSGATGTSVAWIEGAGTLVVTGTYIHKLYWRAKTAGTGSNCNGSGDGGALANWAELANGALEDAAALPGGGDWIVLNNSYASKALAPTTAFNAANKAQGLGGILFEGSGVVNNGSWAVVWGEGALYLAPGAVLSNAVTAAVTTRTWANTTIVGTGLPVTLGTARADATWWQERSLIGRVPAIVDGAGTVRFAAYNVDDPTTHDPKGGSYSLNYSLRVPELQIRRGTAAIGTWYKLTNTVVRFTGSNTVLEVVNGGDAAGYRDLWFGNGAALASDAALAAGSHVIRPTAGKIGALHFKDTPGAAVQTFTGRLSGALDFDFDPASSGYTFVFSGATHDTTGSLLVSNGTVRLEKGTAFTALARLEVAPGAILAFDATASWPADALVVRPGGRLATLDGATNSLASLTINGAAVPGGVYCGAEGTGGTVVDWIAGTGVIAVQQGRRLYWAAKTKDANYDDRLENWRDCLADGTFVPAVTLPQSGNEIVFNPTLHTQPVYVTKTVTTATSAGLSAITFEGADYGVGDSWTVLWGEDALYLAPGALVSNGVARTDRSARIWKTTTLRPGAEPVRFASVAKGRLLMHKALVGTGTAVVEGAGTVQFVDYSHNGATTHEPGVSYYNTYGLRVPEIALTSGTAEIMDWYKLTNTVVRFADSAATLSLVRVTGTSGGKADGDGIWFGNGARLTQDAGVTGTVTTRGGQAWLRFYDTPGAATETFAGKLTGQASVLWNPTPDYTLVLSGATSDTTGELVVSNGTVRLADGAAFTRLARLAVGAGATFALDAGCAFASDRTDLFTQGDERGVLSLAAGVRLTLGCVTVDGVAQPNGLYTKDTCSWITGDGSVLVAGGTWADVVWNRDDHPWALASGVTAYKGIDFYGDSLTKEQLTAASGATLMLGPSGIVSSGKGKSYASAWPIALCGDQTWAIGSGDRIDFHAGLSSVGTGGTVHARKPDSSAQWVFWQPSTATHAWYFETNNTVVLRDGAGLGTGSVTLAHATLMPCGGTVPNDIATTNLVNDTPFAITSMADCGETTFSGAIRFAYAGSVNLTASAGAPIRFAGTVKKPRGYIYFRAGRFTFDKPIDMGSGALSFGASTLVFNAPTNIVGSNNFQFGSSGRLETTVPYALSAAHTTSVIMNLTGSGNAWWDLCGNDQSVTLLKGGPYSTVTSATPAVVHTFTTSDYTADNGKRAWNDGAYLGGVPTNYVAFAGGAGLSVEGKGYLRLCGYSSTTGTLTVAGGGRVEMAASQYYPYDQKTYAGRWPNASAVRVKKGTLAVEHGAAFGPAAEMRLYTVDGAKLDLAAGVKLRVGALYIDDVPQPAGVWGSSASGVPARTQRDACFSGVGRLYVGDVSFGTSIFVR